MHSVTVFPNPRDNGCMTRSVQNAIGMDAFLGTELTNSPEKIIRTEAEVGVFLEELYAAYYDRIHRYFSFRLLNKSDAEDLAQTVFLKVFTSLKKRIWDGAGGIYYIFTIARNTLIDHFRRGKHAMIVSDELIEGVADTMTTAGPIETREQHEMLTTAMEGLHQGEVDAVTLRFFGDLDYRAIAKIMGKREDAVRQLVHRGLRSLRAKLADFI
jgi:RNA polymerase sigma-70 factor (ECF subfamily)